MRGQLSRNPSVSSMAHNKRSDLRLLLGVMGAPLVPSPRQHITLASRTLPSIQQKRNSQCAMISTLTFQGTKEAKSHFKIFKLDEVGNTLLDRASIEPGFTNLVWQILEEENAEFFKACHIRLKLKNQIYMYIQLLEQQYLLIKEQAPTNVGIAPVQKGMQHMTVNNLPMGYPIMQQPLLPCTRYPQINSMGTTSSCHGTPTPENFLHIQQCKRDYGILEEKVLEQRSCSRIFT